MEEDWRNGKLTAMNEQQFWGTVLRVVRSLFLSDRRQIPDVDPPVTRARREDGRVVRGPGQVQHFVGVALEGMQPQLGIAHVVQGNGLRKGLGARREHEGRGCSRCPRYRSRADGRRQDCMLQPRFRGRVPAIGRLVPKMPSCPSCEADVSTPNIRRQQQQGLHHEHLVVSDTGKVPVVLGMPVDVLETQLRFNSCQEHGGMATDPNNRRMPLEYSFGFDSTIRF